MPRKKRTILAMMENLTKTATEGARKRQKRDHPKPKPGKENENVCPPSENLIFGCSRCYLGDACIFNICHERTQQKNRLRRCTVEG